MVTNTEITDIEAPEVETVSTVETTEQINESFSDSDLDLDGNDEKDIAVKQIEEKESIKSEKTETVNETELSDDDYVPEFAEAAAIADAEKLEPEVRVYHKIAEKFGLNKESIKTEDDLFNAMVDVKANAEIDSDPRANELSVLLSSDDETLIREVLNSDRKRYGIFSDSDLENRIDGYSDRNEIESIAEELRTEAQAELDSIFEQKQADIKSQVDVTNSQVQQNVDLTDKILAETSKFTSEFIDAKNLPLVQADLRAYILSGKYQEDVVGLETLNKNPMAAVENAAWVNPKTRNFMLKNMLKQAETGHISDFVKNNLLGKSANVGKGTVAVPQQIKKYSTSDDDLDI